MICTRVSRALYMLRTCKNFLSEKSLKILYYSMVHCHLVYGNQIWGCANGSLITDLYRKQKAAVRIISSSTYRAHTEPIFKQLNILPLPSSNSLNYNLCNVSSKATCRHLLTMYG
jgi:hypothetical protein